MEDVVFSVETTSLPHMRQMTKLTIQSVSVQTLEKIRESNSARTGTVVGVNGGPTEQDYV